MNETIKVFLPLFFACVLTGCVESAPSIKVTATAISVKKQPAKPLHASRQEALALLRHEGILDKNTQVLSATWVDDVQEWLIILQHPKGIISHWFVDSDAKDYSGSTCKH